MPDDDLDIDTEQEEAEQTEAKDSKDEKEPEKRDGLSAEEKQRQRDDYRERRRSNAEIAAQLKAENVQLKKERDEALNKAETVAEVNKVKAEMEVEQARFDVLADHGYNPALRKYITATDEAGILAEVEKMSGFFKLESMAANGSGKGSEDDDKSDKDTTQRRTQPGDKRPAAKKDQGGLKDLGALNAAGKYSEALEEAAKDL